jgi:hypothetical protein
MGKYELVSTRAGNTADLEHGSQPVYCEATAIASVERRR